MSSVVKRAARYGGSFFALALISAKILGPLIAQLQKRKTEEIISDESIIRRFEQALVEGETRFIEESVFFSEMIKNYFNIEGLTERLRTCRQEDKRELWNDMKTLVFARLLTSIYLNYTILILSKVEMVIVAKYLTRNSASKDEIAFDKCRSFMDDIRGFFAILVSEICPIMIEVCRNVLDLTNIDSKIEDMDTIKTIMMQLKRRVDASFSISLLMQKHYDAQILPTEPMYEVLLYCNSHNFQDLLDYMICDGLEEVALSGLEFLDGTGKPKIMLSWITYSSAIFNSGYHKTIHDLLTKKWQGENLVFSHLAVIFCEIII